MKPDDYRKDGYEGKWGREYEASDHSSFTSIPVLQFLNGQPWDKIALAYVSALRPSKIRVNDTGTWKCDANNWRVSVRLAPGSRTILSIRQEVAVDLPDGIETGHDLESTLFERLRGTSAKKDLLSY